MKTYKWQKEQINNKWYSVCTSHKHVPIIKWNSDGTYSVKVLTEKLELKKSLRMQLILL